MSSDNADNIKYYALAGTAAIALLAGAVGGTAYANSIVSKRLEEALNLQDQHASPSSHSKQRRQNQTREVCSCLHNMMIALGFV